MRCRLHGNLTATHANAPAPKPAAGRVIITDAVRARAGDDRAGLEGRAPGRHGVAAEGGELRRRAVGERQVDPASAAEPARRPGVGDGSLRGSRRARARSARAAARGLPGAAASGAARGDGRGERPLRRRAGRARARGRAPAGPRRPRRLVRRARLGQALGRRAAAGDAGPGAGARAAGPAARRADLGPRRGRARGGGGDPLAPARAGQGLDRARHPRPRPGAPDGRLGGAARRGAGGRPGPGQGAARRSERPAGRGVFAVPDDRGG